MNVVRFGPGEKDRRCRGLAVAAGALLLFLSGCSFPGQGSGWGGPGAVDHRVHDGDVPAYSEVTSVSGVAWEWDAPESHLLRDVLAGAGGAVMVLTDGAVGLEGASGEELWHYRISEGMLASSAVTPEGESVVLAYQGESEGDLDVVVLDAGTGELRGEFQARTSESEGEWASHLTEDARLSYPLEGDFGLFAESLETGEPLWEFDGQIPQGAAEFHPGGLSVAGDTVVLSAVFVNGSAEGAGPEDELDQVVSVVGIDADTGEPAWQEEFSVASEDMEVPAHTLSDDGQVLVVEADGAASGADVDGIAPSGWREQWLLDPVTGEQLPGSAFSEGEDRHRVALLGDGYVEALSDRHQVEYSVRGFDGSEREHIEVAARPGEKYIHPGEATDEGVLRLDYLIEGDWPRGEEEAEFLSWEDGEPTVVPVDLSPNELLLSRTEGSIRADASAPRLVPVPGSVVVTEEETGSVRAVGLN